MKTKIREEIERLVAALPSELGMESTWKTPLVGFASASSPIFTELKTAVSPTHALPTDLLEDAASVVAFFLPFADSIAKSNRENVEASREWAVAYIETNTMILEISRRMKDYLGEQGFSAAVIPATHNFDEDKLISDWSHRHVAYIAGLGGFGLNNMLITDVGCCGRAGTFVTSVELEPDDLPCEEACLYRIDGSCRQCADQCVNDALTVDGFDRHRCYEMLMKNEERFASLGKANVCGKCVVALPCSFMNPGKVKRAK